MGQCRCFCRLSVYPDEEIGLTVPLVHNNNGYTIVRIPESHRKKLASAWAADDPFGSWLNEFRKVADIIIGIGINQFTRSGVCMHRGKTKILYMIRPARLIQQDVPVGKAYHAIIKVIDHASAILFTQDPGMKSG